MLFKSTLDINDRSIRTIQEKRYRHLLSQRGKHGKQKTLDPAMREGIRQYINSIPKVESH